MRQPVIAFLHGEVYGKYETIKSASEATGTDRITLKKLINNGAENRKGFSFDEIEPPKPLLELDTSTQPKYRKFTMLVTKIESDYIIKQSKKDKMSRSNYMRLLLLREMRKK